MNFVAPIAYLALSLPLVAADFALSSMRDGDRLEVTRNSTGCFHDATALYEITRVEGGYRFHGYGIRLGKGKEILDRKLIGEFPLTAREVAGLDNLLHFYRGEKTASSTTQVSLLLVFQQAGKPVKVEELKDASGGYGLGERKDIVTFGGLAERLPKLHAGGIRPADPHEAELERLEKQAPKLHLGKLLNYNLEKLEVVYERALELAEDEEHRQALQESQEAWLKFFAADGVVAAWNARGGSFGSVAAGQQKIYQLRSRIYQLSTPFLQGWPEIPIVSNPAED